MYDADVDELDTSPKWAFVDGDCYAYGQNKVPHGIFHSDIHTPAEHTLNGVQHDMEFHIGWQYQEPNATVPNVLVIGFIFQGTNDADEHPFLAKLIEIQNNNITENNPVDLGKNWPEMLGLRSNTSQHDVTFINYIGSGDVPPCLGGIDWWIVDTPIVVAQSQVDTIHGIVQTMFRTDDGNNARPIQSLDDREIRTGDAEDDDTSASFVQCIHMILTAALLNAWLLVY
jgi:carbonic anhydrase